jgi:hypothetical protein
LSVIIAAFLWKNYTSSHLANLPFFGERKRGLSVGQVVPGWRMKATISVNHRISDGAEAAQFRQVLAKYLEEPVRMLV